MAHPHCIIDDYDKGFTKTSANICFIRMKRSRERRLMLWQEMVVPAYAVMSWYSVFHKGCRPDVPDLKQSTHLIWQRSRDLSNLYPKAYTIFKIYYSCVLENWSENAPLLVKGTANSRSYLWYIPIMRGTSMARFLCQRCYPSCNRLISVLCLQSILLCQWQQPC